MTSDREAAIQANRALWNELTSIHVRSSFYQLKEFKKGATGLDEIALAEVGEVVGRSLLHLQCHFGLDTLSWARRGARVTGVDLSDEAISLARKLSRELGIQARFIRADVYNLPATLQDRFDIVFTSWGVLCWLPDLPRWATVIAHHLLPGGTFYLLDVHPLLNLFDAETADKLRVTGSYFHDPAPTRWLPGSDYADPEATVSNPSYEWRHSLDDILNALVGAGFRIEFLHEHQVISWRYFPFLEQGPDRWWRLPSSFPAMPLSISVRATKAS